MVDVHVFSEWAGLIIGSNEAFQVVFAGKDYVSKIFLQYIKSTGWQIPEAR